VVKIPRAGYEETVVIPKAERNVVEVAVTSAVGSGSLWLLSGPASILEEKIPTGILTDAARLLPPPLPNEAIDVLPGTLPEAWQGDETTAVAISAALSQKAGETLPLSVVSEASTVQSNPDTWRPHWIGTMALRTQRVPSGPAAGLSR
jgi:hypothetical protein